MTSEDDGLLQEFYQQLPLGVTRADYSAVKRRLDQLLDEGVGDLRLYLSENSDVLFELVSSIKLQDANDSLLKLFRVDSVREYLDLARNSEHWKKGGWAAFYAQQFPSLVDGKTHSVDYLNLAADGIPIKYSVIAWIPAGREDDWSMVISTHKDITEVSVSKSAGTVQEITERVLAEKRLQESYDLFSQAEQMCNMGHWKWDIINNKMVYCSEQFAKIYGMTVDEALAFFSSTDSEQKIVHPDDWERYLEHNRESLERNEGFEFEYRIITKSGDVRHLRQFSRTIFSDGTYVGTIGTVQDITDKFNAEEKLRQSHALYSQAEELGKLGHWEWDCINKELISCSEQFAKIYGMTVDEALVFFTDLENDLELVHPDDRERYLNHAHEFFEQKKGLDIEYRITTPAGDHRHLHQVSQILLDDEGRIAKSFGTVHDITERAQSEEKLRKSHALFSQAEKIGKLGHWELDHSNNKLVSCSEQLAEIFEMTVDEIIAEFPNWERELDKVHPDDRGRYEQHINDSEEHRKGANIEFRIITAKGNMRHVHLQSQIVTDDQNRIIQSLGTIQDISERVRLESERNRLADQLLQGQKMESLGVLAGGIAHDFNNILSAVLGYAALAQEEAKGMGPLSEYLQQIVKSGKRARNLTQQILAFSRQIDIESHPMDVLSVIREVIGLLRATVPRNTVFEHNLDSDCGTIVANQTAVHQLLLNLCTNAVQAMEPNGGTVTITAGTAKQTELPAELDASAALGWLRIGIADTGEGIPEDIRDKIFDPFFTTKKVGHGTGMGLASVYGIVNKLGGVVQVSSDEGNGTLFEVFLPTSVDPVITPASDRPKSVKGNANILFIDDEQSLVNLAKIQLERLGYSVNGFSDPAEAIASAAADPGRYDILITDFSMPQMNGLDAASKFSELNPGRPVFLITGLDPDISNADLSAAGICRTLIKPYSMADLSRAISESLD